MGRRGNGEGSVRLRADGRWEARVRLPGAGAGERISVYGASRQEVVDAAGRLVRDARMGVSFSDGRQRYSEYLAHWYEFATRGRAESTKESYESAIRLHIEPVIGSVRLGDLRPYHIERVYTRMLAAGLQVSDQVRSVLRSSLDVAEEQGVIARNVARLVRIPRRERAQGGDVGARSFLPDQARQYLRAVSQYGSSWSSPSSREDRVVWPVLAPALVVLLWTGMRVGEVSALRWGEVDLVGDATLRALASQGLSAALPSARVTGTMRHRGGDPVFGAPKTESSRRWAPLAPPAVEALRAWRVTQREWRLRAGEAWWTGCVATRPGHEGERIVFGDLVFTDQIGRPLTYSSIRYAHRRVCERAGLPRIRVHDLRHSCATLLASVGVSPKVVSGMLGHASVEITLDLYSHVQPDMQVEAINRLTRLLG